MEQKFNPEPVTERDYLRDIWRDVKELGQFRAADVIERQKLSERLTAAEREIHDLVNFQRWSKGLIALLIALSGLAIALIKLLTG